MKAVRVLLLILSLLVGHAHACHAIWRLPDGKACGKCPLAICASDKNDPHYRVAVTASSEDCRKCCSLTHCDDEGLELPSSYTYVPPLVMARIEAVVTLTAIPVLTRDPISAVVALHLPHAPPALASARAPPLLLA